jgi:hypothetical protein
VITDTRPWKSLGEPKLMKRDPNAQYMFASTCGGDAVQKIDEMLKIFGTVKISHDFKPDCCCENCVQHIVDVAMQGAVL